MIKTSTSVQSRRRWDEIAFNRITFFRTSSKKKKLKKKQSQAQIWSEVSVGQKQIDRQSRWIQSRLIRRVPQDSRALLNTGHPLPLNPYQIPNTKQPHPPRQPSRALGPERRRKRRGTSCTTYDGSIILELCDIRLGCHGSISAGIEKKKETWFSPSFFFFVDC